MIDILKYKNILIGLVVIIAAFAAYQTFFVNKTNMLSQTSVLITDQANVPEDERTTLQLLSDMQSIKLTANVLQSAAFLSLKDFSVPLQSEPQGRHNPFAPVSGGVSVGDRTTNQAVSTTTAKTTSTKTIK